MYSNNHYDVGTVESRPSMNEKRVEMKCSYRNACEAARKAYKETGRASYVYCHGDYYYRYRVDADGVKDRMYM